LKDLDAPKNPGMPFLKHVSRQLEKPRLRRYATGTAAITAISAVMRPVAKLFSPPMSIRRCRQTRPLPLETQPNRPAQIAYILYSRRRPFVGRL